MPLLKPSTVTGETGAYSFKNTIATSSTNNYIDNTYPNLFDITGNNNITGNNTFTGTNTVTGPGIFAFTEGAEITLDPYSLIVSQGTINLSGLASQLLVGGNLTFETGSSISGSPNLTSFDPFGTITIPNGQTLTVAGAGTGNMVFTAPVNFNSDVVSLLTGAELLVDPFSSVVLNGTLDVGTGAEINVFLNGTVNFENGALLTAGTGTWTFSGTTLQGEILGASLGLAGTYGLLGTFGTATGGIININNGGILNVANGGELVLQSSATFAVNCPLNVNNTFSASGNVSMTGGVGGFGLNAFVYNVAPVTVPNGSVTWTATGVIVNCPIIQLQVTGGILTGILTIDLSGSGLGNTGAISYWDVSRIDQGSYGIIFKNGSVSTTGLIPTNGLITVVCSANNRIVAATS